MGQVIGWKCCGACDDVISGDVVSVSAPVTEQLLAPATVTPFWLTVFACEWWGLSSDTGDGWRGDPCMGLFMEV